MVDLNPAAEYGATARKFLEDSSRELIARDYRQASEKLWGAASQAVMAVAVQRGWDYESHRSMKNAAMRLSEKPAIQVFLLVSLLQSNSTSTSTTAAWKSIKSRPISRWCTSLSGGCWNWPKLT